MRVLVGTSGYSYPEWKGNFYPKKIAAKDMLRWYAERFQTVEINNTFYRMPTEGLLWGWAEQVPEYFSFVLKAPRRITHDKRLQDCGELMTYLVRTASTLGPRLGPLLFQLPPYFKQDVPRLKSFLRELPEQRRAAFEFRHRSWFADEVYETLGAHGAALCVADTGEEPAAPLVATTDWGYLRLRREDFSDQELQHWARRIREQPWREAYVFMKHEEEGRGPKLAARLMEISRRRAVRLEDPPELALAIRGVLCNTPGGGSRGRRQEAAVWCLSAARRRSAVSSCGAASR